MASGTLKDLLLAPRLSFQQVSALLLPYRFKDIKKADENLQRIAEDPTDRTVLAEILEAFLGEVAQSAFPDQALNNFERFAQATFSRSRFLSYLRESPRTLSLLAQVFGGSPFLSDILIRNPEYLYWVFDPEVLKSGKAKRELLREVNGGLRLVKEKKRRLDYLRIFKRKEMLRIGVRDLLREASVEETLDAVSNLAEVLIRKAYEISERELRAKYGLPRGRPRAGRKARSRFTILAMGKLGGGELNFSSDVDLMYLYTSSAGESSGGRGKPRISNAEYFERLAREVTAALHAKSEEGYLYRVDLRLRPEGETGLIAQPLRGYLRYYAARGETWERLSLVKVRPVAGDRSLGRDFLRSILPFVYRRPFGEEGRREVLQLKKKIDERISNRRQTAIHVKLGLGGIREIEFVVQSLQVDFGGKDRAIREPNTLKAMKKLFLRGRLAPADYRRLKESYLFLRDLENKLQMVNDHQTHLLPTDPEEVRACAIRLRYDEKEGRSPSDQLLDAYRFHTERVHRIFETLLAPSPDRI